MSEIRSVYQRHSDHIAIAGMLNIVPADSTLCTITESALALRAFGLEHV